MLLIRSLAAAGVLTAGTLAGPAAAALRCPEPGAPEVRLEFVRPEPVLGTRRMADLRAMAREGLGEHDQALGLYRTEFNASLRVAYSVTTRGSHACVALREAVIDATYVDRTIFIAKELQRGTCRYDVALAHERMHARIDDTVLSRELQALKEELARAAAEIGAVGPIAAANAEPYRADIDERLQRVLQRGLERIGSIREREQAKIDTPESYRREAERCPDGLAVK